MLVTIPVIGVLGFTLLASVRHEPVGSVPPGSRPYIAAPEIAPGPPSVELRHAKAPAACLPGRTASGAERECAPRAQIPAAAPASIH